MSIAADANSGGTSTGTTNTWSHTVGAGSNRVLLVGLTGRGTDPNNTTGVTYGGVALTRVAAFRSPITGLPWLELWQLTNPATGAANIVATYGTSQAHSGVSVSYAGVIQTKWFDLVQTAAEDGSANLTVSATAILANCWIVVIVGTVAASVLSYTGLTSVNRNSQAAVADTAGTVTVGAHSVTVTTDFVDLEAIVLVLEPSGGKARTLFPFGAMGD